MIVQIYFTQGNGVMESHHDITLTRVSEGQLHLYRHIPERSNDFNVWPAYDDDGTEAYKNLTVEIATKA